MNLRQVFARVSMAFGVAAGTAWGDPTLFLSSPADSANVRLNLAQNAKSEVLAVSYIFRSDRAGITLLAQLREAARQGKRAVLVVDALGGKISPNLFSYLASEGVEIYRFHPFDWKNPKQYNKRLHSKLFIVDGEHLVIGDRNVGDEYFGLSDQSYVSRDAYVRGKVAQDAKSHIEELIKSNEVVRVKPTNLNTIEHATEKAKLDWAYSKPMVQKLRKSDSWKQKVFDSDSVEFYHDPIAKKGISPGVDLKVVEAMDRAQKQITFENAYVVLPDSLKQALKRAVERGVKVRVITNSVESTNSRWVRPAWEDSKRFLASIGAEVWERPADRSAADKSIQVGKVKERFRKVRKALAGKYESKAGFNTLHAKTMTIDDDHSYIMSYNFDPRSEKLNMETALHVKGEKFADILKDEIARDVFGSNYRLVALNGALQGPSDESKMQCFKRMLVKLFESQL